MQLFLLNSRDLSDHFKIKPKNNNEQDYSHKYIKVKFRGVVISSKIQIKSVRKDIDINEIEDLIQTERKENPKSSESEMPRDFSTSEYAEMIQHLFFPAFRSVLLPPKYLVDEGIVIQQADRDFLSLDLSNSTIRYYAALIVFSFRAARITRRLELQVRTLCG